jgi:hypothetical protein
MGESGIKQQVLGQLAQVLLKVLCLQLKLRLLLTPLHLLRVQPLVMSGLMYLPVAHYQLVDSNLSGIRHMLGLVYTPLARLPLLVILAQVQLGTLLALGWLLDIT